MAIQDQARRAPGGHEDTQDEVVDLADVEDFGKRGETPPKARQYRVRIDKKHYTVDVPAMTGSQLLELAGKRPAEKYMIHEKLKGGALEQVELDETADFRKPGVERFQTMPLNETEG